MRKAETPPKATFDTILLIAAQEFGVRPKDILGKSRLRTISLARHATAYVARKLSGMSYPEIGIAIRQVDHTSAMHAFRRITELIAVDEETAGHIENIERKVLAHTKAMINMGLIPPYSRADDLPGLYAPAPPERRSA